MSVVALTAKKRKFSRGSLQAADRLLQAVKEKILREKGKIDYTALRQGGYSDEIIARLKQI